jgi:N-acetylated-alpha-linked acidic dipeptidase
MQTQSRIEANGDAKRTPEARDKGDTEVGDLGSGSDYTAFLQHLGVPATDVGSSGAYGVYHSVFDNFAWFKKFGDPNFVYTQQMARVFGVEVLRMANIDVLPYDYEDYAREISVYLETAKKKAESEFGAQSPNFSDALDAAHKFEKAGNKALAQQRKVPQNPAKLNEALRHAERALLVPDGLPNRPWFRHAIYAPGQYTGYAAVVIPGVNEAIDKHDLERTQQQLAVLTGALQRAASALESYR